MKSLLIVLCITCSVAYAANLPGGVQVISKPDTPEARKAVALATDFAKENKPGKEVKVEGVQIQFVAGTNYIVSMTVGNDKCKVVVHRTFSGEYETIANPNKPQCTLCC